MGRNSKIIFSFMDIIMLSSFRIGRIERSIIMKRACLVTIIGLFIFCSAGLVNATPITQNFYIKVTKVAIGPSVYDPNGYYDAVAAMAAIPTTYRVGDYVSGSVTFDNSNIPSSGSFIIGGGGWGSWLGPSEYQDWNINYAGLTNFGFIIWPASVLPELYFIDGIMSSIYAEYNANVAYGLQSEYILGNRVQSLGIFLYDAWLDDCGWTSFDASFNIEGDLYFGSIPSNVPEPHTIFLLGLGLIVIAGIRRTHPEFRLI